MHQSVSATFDDRIRTAEEVLGVGFSEGSTPKGPLVSVIKDAARSNVCKVDINFTADLG